MIELAPVLRQLSRQSVCLRGEVAQALYRDGNEPLAAVGAGTGILIGTGDLEIVRNTGTLPQVLNGQSQDGEHLPAVRGRRPRGRRSGCFPGGGPLSRRIAYFRW
jgi:hypothetical protein